MPALRVITQPNRRVLRILQPLQPASGRLHVEIPAPIYHRSIHALFTTTVPCIVAQQIFSIRSLISQNYLGDRFPSWCGAVDCLRRGHARCRAAYYRYVTSDAFQPAQAAGCAAAQGAAQGTQGAARSSEAGTFLLSWFFMHAVHGGHTQHPLFFDCRCSAGSPGGRCPLLLPCPASTAAPYLNCLQAKQHIKAQDEHEVQEAARKQVGKFPTLGMCAAED